MEPLRHRAGRARAAEVREGAHVWCVRSHGTPSGCGRETDLLIVLQKKRCTGVAGRGSPLITSGGVRVPARRITSPNRSYMGIYMHTGVYTTP